MIERLRREIEIALQRTDPAPLVSLETLLLLLSYPYEAALRLRARLYAAGVLRSRKLPCHVISIGNITAGGTGKTPMTILVAQLIRELGYRVVVISRGYRGRFEATGGVVSDGETIFLGPEDAGDEPSLMARVLKGIPVLVGRRRYETGRLAMNRFNPDVIVLDDAFQHMGLKRDLDLVLLDGRSPFGNGHLLPRGPLREPVSALKRAQAVVYTRCSPSIGMPLRPKSFAGPRPVFYARHAAVIRAGGSAADPMRTETTDLSQLASRKVVAFGGVADNRPFFDSLEEAGCVVLKKCFFADHHRYRIEELAAIAASAEQLDVDRIVTTFKDFVKVSRFRGWTRQLIAVDVSIRFCRDGDRFRTFIADALGLNRF